MIFITQLKANPFIIKGDHQKNTLIDQVKLEYVTASDLKNYRKYLPCTNCKIIESLDVSSLTLIANNQQDLINLKKFIEMIDVPKKSLMVAINWYLIHDHELDSFLTSVAHQPVLDSKLFKNILFEMERKGYIKTLARPIIQVYPGSQATLSTTEELKTHEKSNHLLAIDVKLDMMNKANDEFELSFDITQNISSPYWGLKGNKEKLKTTLIGHKGEIVFLGGVGKWVEGKERFIPAILKFLPKRLRPRSYYKATVTSQLIVIAELY